MKEAVTQLPIFGDLKAGFKQLSEQKLRPYVLPILVISIVTFLYDWGFSRPSMAFSFGYDEKTQPLIFALMSVAAAILVGFLTQIRKKTRDFVGLNSLNFLIGIGFVLSYLKLGWYGVFVMLLIELSWNLAEPWISVIINNNIGSTYRATTLSTMQFIAKIPFLVINIFLGESIDGGYMRLFNLGLGILIVLFGLYGFMKYKGKISTSERVG